MLKKRIIFTLLYDNGHFMLSRNFRLQRVGDAAWLKKNYNFSHISFYIDELVVLDITRGERDLEKFCRSLESLTEGCFVPIAAGGGVRSIETARMLLRSGADKVVVNTPLFEKGALLEELASEFGQQCIVGSLDFKRTKEGDYEIWVDSGSRCLEESAKKILSNLDSEIVGEWYLNSIDQDGTGQGYDLDILNQIPGTWSMPVILAGGAGNSSHMKEGLNDERVDAIATAHLFNFVGDGLKQARLSLVESGTELASWPTEESALGNKL